MVEMQKELRKNNGSLPGSDKHGGIDGAAASMYRLANKSGTKKAKIWSTFGVVVLLISSIHVYHVVISRCCAFHVAGP